MLELRVNANVIFCDGEVIGRGQALLLGSILRIGLHVHAEHFTGDGRDDFVRRHRTVTADRVAAHREGAGRSHIRVICYGKGRLMFNSKREVRLWALAEHVIDDGDEVAGADIAAAQSGRSAMEFRHTVQIRVSRRSGNRVREGGLDFGEHRIRLHHLCYYLLKQSFPKLGAQMCCNAIAKTAAVLKAQKYPKQVLFKKGRSVHFDKRTYSLKGKILSLFTLRGRIQIALEVSPFHQTFFDCGMPKEAEFNCGSSH